MITDNEKFVVMLYNTILEADYQYGGLLNGLNEPDNAFDAGYYQATGIVTRDRFLDFASIPENCL